MITIRRILDQEHHKKIETATFTRYWFVLVTLLLFEAQDFSPSSEIHATRHSRCLQTFVSTKAELKTVLFSFSSAHQPLETLYFSTLSCFTHIFTFWVNNALRWWWMSVFWWWLNVRGFDNLGVGKGHVISAIP